MNNTLIKVINRSLVPRWYILLIDVFFVASTYFIALFLRQNLIFESLLSRFLDYPGEFVTSVIAYFLSFLVLRSFSPSVRFLDLKDLLRILSAVSLGATTLALIFLLSNLKVFFFLTDLASPLSVILIQYFVLLFVVIWSRILFKNVYEKFLLSGEKARKVVIYGAGTLGQIAKNIYEGDMSSNNKVVAFADDSKVKIGKMIAGVTVLPRKEVLSKDFLAKNSISEIVIAIDNIASKDKRRLVDKCLERGLEVKQTPSVHGWVNGELSAQQIKKVRIEDLLDRKPILLDKENLSSQLKDQVVLVTGGAGSIGSEIALQLTYYAPREIILLDQSETGLYDIERKIRAVLPSTIPLEIMLADVSNREKLRLIFDKYLPTVVYHAAAYKHVPMMENNPSEAVSVNVFGSKNLADLASEYAVKKFVFVSTDKAVNPTNVMGASKRLAEIYIQSLNAVSQTKFITTRFGNVLGSNGSVIPLFREQIAKGGPVTVTSDKITRYFMTIPEACQLVMEAGAMGAGGEIYVFDMGEPVKIIDLAKKMIKLSGLKIDQDIDLEILGLRPGEKLYEELLNNDENTLPTHHPKIMIGKTRKYDFESLTDLYENLAGQSTDMGLVKKMKSIIPEFISNNSPYEVLDNA